MKILVLHFSSHFSLFSNFINMHFYKVLTALSFTTSVLSEGLDNISDFTSYLSSDDVAVIPSIVIDEVSKEILLDVQATHNSSIVPADVVYNATFEVAEKHGDSDDKTQEILAHITDAVSELELIHAGESGPVSDIIAEIMFKAYGSEAPTPAPTAKITELTMINGIKNKIVDTTESITEAASGLISSVLNPSPKSEP